MGLILLIGSQFFFIKTTINFFLTGITLVMAMGFGWMLIRSVKKEIERRDQLQEMSDRLARANDELRKLDNAKSEFISIASHQLRTPLTAIKGFISLILEGSYGKISPEIQDILNKVYASNDRIVQLVENLLNISRIESGRIQYQFEKASIETILKELSDMFFVMTQGRNLTLTFTLPKEKLPLIYMDAPKIREVISNLIDNALKYTEKGGILATALFLHRDLTLHPNTTGLVSAVDLIHRRGPAFYGHVDEDLARFLHGLQDYLGQETSKQERGVRIGTAAQWIREYVLDGTLPNLGPHAPRVRVLDVGTNGFVLAESDQPSPKCWEVLYRLGFLRGVVLGPLVDSERRTVLVSKKSSHVQFDLARAALHLNELEVLSGGDSEWEVSGEYLTSPTEGSVVLANYILQVLLRV
jgi:hypothetical protein